MPAFADWLTIERGYSSHTVECYSRDVGEFFQSINKEINLQEISREHIGRYISSLYLVNSGSSVARKMSALRTFFKYCLRRGRIGIDPLAGIAGPKRSRHIPTYLTVDEVFSLLEEPKKKDRF
ncbi:MAG: tyrosine recombinase XerC, partial [Candidatus Electrothrix sp. AUS1_2]|nr:tyrosine recombinase XerC [Candidatus Electrothrix sp. AUS1_2]